MEQHKQKRSPSPSLRQQALARLKDASPSLSDLSHEEILKLAHELQVHQIELELQNEELKSITAELERSRTLFFNLFNQAPVGYVLLDKDGVIQEANRTFCDFTQTALGEVMEKPIQSFIYEADRAPFLGRYRALFRKPPDKQIELRLKRGSLPPLWTRIQAEKFLFEEQGQQPLERLLVAFIDLSAQKEVEEQKRKETARLQALEEITRYPYQSVEDLLRFTLEKAVTITESQVGYLLEVDEEAQVVKIWLISEGVSERSRLDLTDYDQPMPLGESGLRVEAVRQRKAVIINDYAAPHPHKKGYPPAHIEIERFLSVPVFEGGKIVAVVSVANKPADYSENDARQLSLMLDSAWKIVTRQHLMDALQRSEARFRTLFENMVEGFALHEMIWDDSGRPKDYRFLEVNPAFVRLTGLRVEEIVGKTVRELLPDLEQSWIDRYGEVAASGKSMVFQEYSAPLNKWYEVRAFSPQQGYFATIFWDITDQKRIEQELRESEANFRTFVESHPDMVMVGTRDGRVLYANNTAVSKLGYSLDELNAIGMLGVHPPAVRQEAEQIYAAMFRGERTTCPLPVQSKDGLVIPVETRVSFGKWNGEECIFGVIKDLTAEQEALQLFERLFRNNPALMAISKLPPDQSYVDVNDAFVRTLGYERNEVIGKTSQELGLFPNIEQQKAAADILATKGSIANIELDVRAKDGSMRQGLFWGEVITSQGSEYILTVMLDITNQKRMEQELRESASQFRGLFDQAADAIFIAESETGILLNANQKACELLKSPLDKVIGKHLKELHPPSLMEYSENKFIEHRQETEKGLPSSAVESKLLCSDGTEIPVEVRASQIIYQGKKCLMGIFRDITERNRLEEERNRLIQDLQRKNAELGQFTYTVSHDLKSPLITILGFLGFVEQSLESGDLSQAQADLQRIRFAAEKMQALLEGLLELSRIGRLVNPATEFPLSEVVLEALQLVLGTIQQQKRPVEFEIAPDLPRVYGDRARILQVMQNLLDNALKYLGEQPEPRVEIGWADLPSEVHIYVRDNGVGIAPEYQEKVFGLFEKLDPRAQGYGVGLALVKRIIEVHGGRVWVESQGEGEGCTFWFSLPKNQAQGREKEG